MNDLCAILVLGLAASLYAGLAPARARAWILLAASVAAIYWLQPPLPIRYSGYIFPTLTLALTVAIWRLAGNGNNPAKGALAKGALAKGALASAWSREDRVTLGVIAALVVALSFLRNVQAEFRVIATRPPEPLAVAAALLIAGASAAGLARLTRNHDPRRCLTMGILLIAGVFILLKTQPLAAEISRVWRGLAGQDPTLASGADLNWLGFSYVAFRLIHTLRERQTGQLPALALREYVTYVIFFPAFAAGPIDRAERFAQDFRALPGLTGWDVTRLADGWTRITLGLLYKFVIADSLAQGVTLTPVNAAQASSAGWLWVLLYGYALRLFFDFAGYSHVAIGLGLVLGIRLPENFDRPYSKTSLTAFWQSWHMTLSNWARFYVFSPLSRWMLMQERRPSPAVMVFVAQLATMLVIGLWHGVTVNFVVWGAWHAAGLYVHKQWSDRTRKWYRSLNAKPWRKRAWTALTWAATFQYVVLGWVWFALPDTGQAARVMARLLAGLFGLGG